VIRWHCAHGRDYRFCLHAGQLALGDNQPRQEELVSGGCLPDTGLHLTPVHEELQLTREGRLFEGAAEAGNIGRALANKQNGDAGFMGHGRRVGGRLLGLARAGLGCSGEVLF
jgi:hypothetical protein